MRNREFLNICCVFLFLQIGAVAASSKNVTLRSSGAVGDGKTDDRAAIENALIKAQGAPVDGEGATYAVHGNIELKTNVTFRNATLVQTMEPVDIARYIPSATGKGELTVEPAKALLSKVGSLPLMHASGVASYSEDPILSEDDLKTVVPTIDLRTLSIKGSKDKPVSVRLEKVVIKRGNHPQTGGWEAGGIMIYDASPVQIKDVEVTGDGHGCGISIRNSSNIELQKLNIHDMVWEPYIGDNIYQAASLKSIKEDFGWNTFPVYRFDPARKRFVRVRIQEQISGLEIYDCKNVELLDSRIDRIQTKIGNTLLPLQTDGVTINKGSHIHVKNCHISQTWEGIDFTGTYGDHFLYADCTSADNFTFAFKLAHPKRDGKMVNCTAYRSGNAGFVLEPEMENIEFINCHAFETGSNGYWTKDDGSRVMTIGGFRLFTNRNLPEPLRVKFEQCSAINAANPGSMDFGFASDGGIDLVKREIIATGCTVKGARVKDIHEIVIQK